MQYYRHGGSRPGAGRKRGYRSPSGRRPRVSFVLSDSEADALNQHRFDNESNSELLNRLLTWLSEAIAEDVAPFKPFPTSEHRHVFYSFRPNPAANELIQTEFDQLGKDATTQAAIASCVNWALKIPIITPFNSEQAYDYLHSAYQQQSELIPLHDALRLMMRRCSSSTAKNWLLEWRKQGKIKLHRQRSPAAIQETRIGRNQYSYLSFL